MKFLNQTAGQVLVVAVIFVIVRLLRQAESKPIVDVLSVAFVGGVTTQFLRMRRAGGLEPGTRALAVAVAAAAIACWAGGIWLERKTPDAAVWIAVCGVMFVAGTILLESFRKRPAAPTAPAPRP